MKFKSCLTKHYFQTQTLFFKTVAWQNRTIERPNHILSVILMNILPSFSSIRRKLLSMLTKFFFLFPFSSRKAGITRILRTTIKMKKVHSISYKLHQYMPCNILVPLIQCILLLLHCSHSKGISGLSPWSFLIFFLFYLSTQTSVCYLSH